MNSNNKLIDYRTLKLFAILTPETVSPKTEAKILGELGLRTKRQTTTFNLENIERKKKTMEGCTKVTFQTKLFCIASHLVDSTMGI